MRLNQVLAITRILDRRIGVGRLHEYSIPTTAFVLIHDTNKTGKLITTLYNDRALANVEPCSYNQLVTPMGDYHDTCLFVMVIYGDEVVEVKHEQWPQGAIWPLSRDSCPLPKPSEGYSRK